MFTYGVLLNLYVYSLFAEFLFYYVLSYLYNGKILTEINEHMEKKDKSISQRIVSPNDSPGGTSTWKTLRQILRSFLERHSLYSFSVLFSSLHYHTDCSRLRFVSSRSIFEKLSASFFLSDFKGRRILRKRIFVFSFQNLRNRCKGEGGKARGGGGSRWYWGEGGGP